MVLRFEYDLGGHITGGTTEQFRLLSNAGSEPKIYEFWNEPSIQQYVLKLDIPMADIEFV